MASPTGPIALPVPAVKLAPSSNNSQLYAEMQKISERLKEKKEAKTPSANPTGIPATNSPGRVAIDSQGLTVGLRRPQREEEIKHSKRILFLRLSGLKLKEHVMNDDGNCLFSAISHQIYGTPDHHEYVRQCCAKQLKTKPDQYSIFFDSKEEYVKYIQEIESCGHWGDEITIKASCDYFAFVAHVILSSPGNWFLRYIPNCCTTEKDISFMYKRRQIFMSYLAPIHYNSITYEDDTFVMFTPDEGTCLPELHSAM
jgi:hypothetical protein